MSEKKWAECVLWIHQHWEGPITAKELAQETQATEGSCLQTLRRLRSWGYVRLSTLNVSGKPGRPTHSYQLTPKGIKRAEWMVK